MTEFLDRLRQEAPILLIEHDMDAVFQLADRISVLVYGRVIATAQPPKSAPMRPCAKPIWGRRTHEPAVT